MEMMEFQTQWRLGKLRPEQVDAQAVEWLEAGYDGPNLRELAWHHDSFVVMDTLLIAALGEMGHAMITEDQARMRCACRLATQMVEGALDPYEGAERIYWECWEADHEDVPEEIEHFYRLTISADLDEHAEFVPSPELKATIREAARAFLERGPDVGPG
jgi:hypothetical protein